jgi:DNA polymerase-1
MAFGKGHHLHLVDGSAFIFRAYHALPPLTRKSDGLPIGAVSGFCNMLWNQIIKDHGADAPTHAAVVFDKGSRTLSATTFMTNTRPIATPCRRTCARRSR